MILAERSWSKSLENWNFLESCRTRRENFIWDVHYRQIHSDHPRFTTWVRTGFIFLRLKDRGVDSIIGNATTEVSIQSRSETRWVPFLGPVSSRRCASKGEHSNSGGNRQESDTKALAARRRPSVRSPVQRLQRCGDPLYGNPA